VRDEAVDRRAHGSVLQREIVGDAVPGFEASAFSGVGAPKSMPNEIVDTLNKEVNAALADPKIKARLADLGGMMLSGSPTEFGRLIADDTEKWRNVIRAANIKAEYPT
jgi:tripartite-type tricarboxylate transporter receptor subunit TctC